MTYLFIPITKNHINMFKEVSKYLKDSMFLDISKIKHFYSEKDLVSVKSLVAENIDEKSIENIVKSHGIKVFILGNDVEPIMENFIKVGKKLNVKTVLIQDGTICNEINVKVGISSYMIALKKHSIKYLIKAAVKKLRKKDSMSYRYGSKADVVFAWGNFSKKVFVGNGASPKNVRVVGSININKSFKNRGPSKKSVMSILYAPTDGIGTLYNNKNYIEMARIVKNVCDKNHYRLIIKEHPYYEGLNTLPKDIKKFVISGNIYDIINESDIVITDYSTIAIEAVVFGKIVGIINITKEPFRSKPYPDIYIKSSVGFLISSEKDIENLVKKIKDKKFLNLWGKRKDIFIQDQLNSLKLNVAEIIAKKLREFK